MDRYGLASGKNFNTIADREFDTAHSAVTSAVFMAVNLPSPTARLADRQVKQCVRRLVRAALDVERQRNFERGIEAFAAMPMVRERNVTSGPGSRWTPGTYCGD